MRHRLDGSWCKVSETIVDIAELEVIFKWKCKINVERSENLEKKYWKNIGKNIEILIISQ